MSLSTCLEHLQYWASWDLEKSAFTFYRQDMTTLVLRRQEVSVFSAKIASRLWQAGVRTGTVLCSLLSNSPERVALELGAICIGGVVFNGRQFSDDRQSLVDYLNLCQTQILVLDPGEAGGGYEVVHSLVTSHDGFLVTSDLVPSLQQLFYCERSLENKPLLFESLEEESSSVYSLTTVDVKDPAVLLVAGGPKKKLALHTHQSWLELARFHAKQYRVPDNSSLYVDSSLEANPEFWHHYVIFGIHCVLPDVRSGAVSDPAAFTYDVIQKEKCGAAILPPWLIQNICSRRTLWYERSNAPPVFMPMIVHTGGHDLTPDCLTAVGRIAKEVTASIDLPEAGPLAILSYHPLDPYRRHCVGKPYVRARIRILDENLAEEVDVGTHGLIVVRSPSLFDRYFNDEEATSAAFADGCNMFVTGCRGFLDSEGYLYVTERNVVITRRDDATTEKLTTVTNE